MPAPSKKTWSLSEQSFHSLLDFLDADRSRAALEYEKVREKLSRLFEWRGCIPGDEYADETIDRVCRKIEEGVERRPDNPYLYFHGVALNLIREHWRKPPREQPLETLPPALAPAVDPHDAQRQASIAGEHERRLACLHECLDRLPPASREMLTTYHLGGPGIHIGTRRGLAEVLNIPGGALRLRVFRIRRQMEKCLNQCIGRRGETVFQ